MKKITSVIALAAIFVFLWVVVVVSAAPEESLANSISIEPVYQNGDTTVQVGDIFTQRVRFERTDATGLLQFEIQIAKSIMFETFTRPSISKSGSVNTNKVFQTDDTLNWRGSVTGDGFVEIDIPSRVGDCGKPPEECPSTIAVSVLNNSGEVAATDEATVSLVAGDFDRSNMIVTSGYSAVTFESGVSSCLIDCEPAVVVMTNNNAVPARVVIRGEAPAGMKWNRSVPAIFSDMDFNDGRAAENNGEVRFFDVSLEPSETTTLTLNLALTGNRADEAEFTVALKACTERAGNVQCPFDDGLVDLDDLNFRSRRRDLGDAPDSSNHFATAMEAYSGVQGNFPTTADTTLAGPHGPVHARPWPLHLGRRVSFEAEADVGPDQDGVNNIEPSFATPLANLDRGDDGVALSRLDFDACQVETFPVQVAILPSAVAIMEGPAYLNVWLDGNRDGDWDDEANCDETAYEHIVIDHELDVATLGAGFHTISVTTNLIPKGVTDSADGMWMRVTLSDEASTKLTGETYGDGRGKGSPYLFGETEDYLVYPVDSEGYQPDIQIEIEEIDRGDERRDDLATDGRGPDAVRRADRELIIRFRNNGFKAAENLEIDVTLGNALDEILYDSWSGCLTCVRSSDVHQSHDTVLRGPDSGEEVSARFRTFEIGRLEPREFGTIVVGYSSWCLTCVRAVEAPDAAVFNTVLARTPELQWESKLERRPNSVASPFVRLGWSGCLTCVRQVEDGQAITGWDEGVAAIKARPGQTIKLLKNGEETGQSGVADADGFWITNLEIDPDSRAAIQAVAMEGALQSEPSNILDMSCSASGIQILVLAQTNEDGEVKFVPHLQPPDGFGLPDLRYTYSDMVQGLPKGTFAADKNILAYRNCRDQQSELSLNYLGEDIEFDGKDEFGDLTVLSWSGCLTCTRSAASTDVTFSVVATPTGKTSPFEYTSSYVAVMTHPFAFVTHPETGDPIAGAEVTVLRKAKKGSGRETWVDVGHCVTTLQDGSWSALVPEGEYMVVVKADGYQTYRSQPVAVSEENNDRLFDKISGRYELGFNIGMPPNVASTETAQVVDISNGNLGNVFVHISANTPVRFENNGGADTSLTAQIDGRGPQATSIDSGLFASGESFVVQFDEPGTYTYQVAGDEEQTGVIEVTSSGTTIYLPAIMR